MTPLSLCIVASLASTGVIKKLSSTSSRARLTRIMLRSSGTPPLSSCSWLNQPTKVLSVLQPVSNVLIGFCLIAANEMNSVVNYTLSFTSMLT